MRAPRRIFRQPARRPRVPWPLLLATVAVAVTVALGLTGMSTELFGRSPPPPSHLAAEADAVAVIDGDTLRLRDQVIRLRGVEAPDRGDHCAGGRNCGTEAAATLANLVRGRRVACAVNGHDEAGRPFAACDAGGADLSRAIVASGWARARPGAPELADLELRARRQRQGLWASP